jgi:hypothetical protein
LCLQLLERLSHGNPADLELAGDVGFVEPISWLESTGENRIPNPIRYVTLQWRSVWQFVQIRSGHFVHHLSPNMA